MDAGLLIATGLAGSVHCAGMCGGLAILVTGSRSRLRNFAAYAAGKTVIYLWIGALAGAFGRAILNAAPLGSRILSFAAAIVLLLAAAESVGLIRYARSGPDWLRGLGKAVAGFASERGTSGRVLLGAANALLPCPMVYAFGALAAESGSPIRGAFAMLVLSATSTVPLAACTATGSGIQRRAPRFSRYALPALLLVMTALLALRALPGTSPHCH